jgi:hypothetical protein
VSMTAERRILAWLERADFDGTGCRHSQDTIAKAVGYSREHVNRCLRQLAKTGRIRVEKERRPGCKWPCNVYHLPAWNPNKRASVLNVLKAIRDQRNAGHHTERTARPRRVPTPPSPRCRHYHCSGRGKHQISARRAMCNDCRDLSEQNAKLTDELSGALHAVRKLGAENVKLRGASVHSPESDIKTANVWIVLENWLWLCRGRKRNDGKGRLPLIDPGSTRWTIASRAIKREPEGVHACLEAIEGLAAKPYVISGQGRSATGRPSQRVDDIQYALKDETTVERCRRYRAEVLGASEAVLFHAWQACSATDHFYFVAWSGKRARDQHERLPSNKQDRHRAELERAWAGAEVIDLQSRRSAA